MEEKEHKTASELFTVFIHRVNNPPRITIAPTLPEVNAGSTLQLDIEPKDDDLISRSLKWSIIKSYDFAILERETGKLPISPDEEKMGSHDFLVRVEDPESAFNDLVLAVLVNGNEPNKEIQDWVFKSSRVRIIPVEIYSKVRNEEPYYVVDESTMIIYYPFRKENIEESGDGSNTGYIAFFMILVSVITIFIHIFLKK